MNVHLGDLEDYVQQKLSGGGYGSAAEVIREALRNMRDRETEDAIERRLESYVLNGIDQGPPDGVSAEDWDKRLVQTRDRMRAFIREGIESAERDGWIEGDDFEKRVKARRESREGQTSE